MADAFKDRLDGSLNTSEGARKATGRRARRSPVRRFRRLSRRRLTPDLDLVILTTPPGFRPIHFEAAVKAGKHVFMEKPVAVDAAGVRRFWPPPKRPRRRSWRSASGLQRHHRDNYREAIQRMHDGDIGDMVYTRVYWNSAGHGFLPADPDQSEMDYQMRNWYYFNWLCGDHITEQHIHHLDVDQLAQRQTIRSRPTAWAAARCARTKSSARSSITHFVEFEYDDGIADDQPVPPYSQLLGLGLRARSRHQGLFGHRRRYIKSPAAADWRLAASGDNGYQIEHDDLFASIRNGNPINEAEYGANSSMTSILGRMATYGGKIVEWKDAIASQINLAPQEYSFQATPPVVPDANGFYPVAVPGVTRVV